MVLILSLSKEEDHAPPGTSIRRARGERREQVASTIGIPQARSARAPLFCAISVFFGRQDAEKPITWQL
jgi:hypothetical protein